MEPRYFRLLCICDQCPAVIKIGLVNLGLPIVALFSHQWHSALGWIFHRTMVDGTVAIYQYPSLFDLPFGPQEWCSSPERKKYDKTHKAKWAWILERSSYKSNSKPPCQRNEMIQMNHQLDQNYPQTVLKSNEILLKRRYIALHTQFRKQ